MTKKLTTADLNHAQSLLDSGGPSAMYSYLYNEGYNYAKLADGVALNNTLAGASAIEFMKTTAESAGTPLSDANVEKIKSDMASEYLNTLKSIAVRDNYVDRDITGTEARSFHTRIFDANGLTIDAWTLNAIIEILHNPKNIEDYWKEVLGSAGDPDAEIGLAVDTLSVILYANETGEHLLEANVWLAKMLSGKEIGAARPYIQAAIIMNGSGLINKLKSMWGTAETTRSPLILDLDGNGRDYWCYSGRVL